MQQAWPDGELIDFTRVMELGLPYQVYPQLLSKGGVYKDPGNGFYVVSNYAAVRRIAGDNKTWSNKTGITVERETPVRDIVDRMYAEQAWPQIHTLVTNDPPSHRMFRSLVERLFAPQRVLAMIEGIQVLVDELVDKVIDVGSFDVINDLAFFPAIVAGDFLGLPREDIPKLKEYTDASNALTEPTFDEENEIAMNRKVIELLHYMLERANLSAANADGTFMHHVRTMEVDGRRLTNQELVWFVQPLFVGGHDSVTLLLASGMLRLAQMPALQDRLRNEPELIDNFIEELMRFDTPVQTLWRRALADVEVQGTLIPADSTVQLQWAAANRDPAKFENPDVFDVDRPNARQHLAFGAGPHVCIGNQLARAEMRIAFETVLRRMGNLRIAGGPDNYKMRRHYMQWGVEKLNLVFDKR